MFEILAHFLLSAHALEAGIVATNAWLVKATYSAIPADDRPHNRVIVFCGRAPRAVMLHVRHQHRLRMIDAGWAAFQAEREIAERVMAHHRAKFQQG